MDNLATIVLGFPEYEAQAQRLARALDLPFDVVEIHRFPDGESSVRLPIDTADHVIFCRSLDHPNDKLIELFFAAATAREMQVRKLTLVAPYLCYMRQDIAFRPGEAISQHVLGRHLANLFDQVVTVDPHLHRTHHIEEAVPARNPVALGASLAIAEFLVKTLPDALLLGPDQESEQWVRAITDSVNLDYAIATKKRSGDRDVSISLPQAQIENRKIVLIDDIASTGNTLARTAEQAKLQGAAEVHAIVTHALFVENAIEKLHAAGVQNIWSTDSVKHPTNIIALADTIAEAMFEQCYLVSDQLLRKVGAGF